MTLQQVMTQLEGYGNPSTKNTFLKHGAKEPFFGVKVGDLKKIVKKIKKNYTLSKELYATGNSDAMYLAGLIADEQKMTKDDLNQWVEQAYWYMISDYTVAWIAAETPYGWDIGLEWIASDKEMTASAGWATLSSYLAITPNEAIDIDKVQALMNDIGENIHQAKNRVRYSMNGFIIACGTYIPELTDEAIALGKKIGKVAVNMGGTACKVPLIPTYLQKVVDKGRVGKKRKMARC